MRRIVVSVLMVVILAGVFPASGQHLKEGDGKRWYKGNTHAHTLWSDGDAAPEKVVDWYKEHGYDFLCLSDHNIYLEGEQWIPVHPNFKLTPERLEGLIEQFGEDWVDLQTSGERVRMRLKTLTELKAYFEEPETFLLIPAEEVTTPTVHLNAINNQGFLEPLYIEGEDSVRKTLLANFEAIEAHEEEHGAPVLAHINHPNWDSGVTAEDMIAVGGERFFEVYNGHSGVKNWGDERQYKKPTDRLWDIILSMRMKEGARYPMYGMATDDSHNYYKFGLGQINSGRGWVQVLAEELSAEALIPAMKRGEFYASSGVELREIQADDTALRVSIEPEDGVTFTTQFIGTMKEFDATSRPVLDAEGEPIPWVTRIYSDDIGHVLQETTANPAVYEFSGEELYVRAKVVSSKLQDNPFAEGDREMAWTQPIPIN